MIVKIYNKNSNESIKNVTNLFNRIFAKNKSLKTLKGSFSLTKNIIKNSPYKNRFIYGGLHFKKRIDDSLKKEIIKEFEKLFFAGLREDQFNSLWIDNDKKNRTIIHFVLPNIELKRFKYLKIYYFKTDFYAKLAFEKYINKRYNLIEPNKFENKRRYEDIEKDILEKLKEGLIKNFNDLKGFLNLKGYNIVKRGDYYNLSYIVVEKDGKRLYLKGDIYSNSWDISKDESLEELKEKLNNYITKIKENNKAKFSSKKTIKSKLNKVDELLNMKREIDV